ncbi:MAG: hypothetical protein M3O61_14780, partial [Gemmatimonadota bacterium]|nr:hypothetical protein [Gemmatimonadota bacterium]
MPQCISVVGFESLQHYRDRSPPWIKLYNSLLDEHRFLQLSDTARCQLMLLWLVASRHHNRIPYDKKYIAEAIHCSNRLQLQALLDGGFLQVVDAAEHVASATVPMAARKRDASRTLSARSKSAHPEEELETEVEITTSYNCARDELLGELPSDYRTDATAFLDSLGKRDRRLAWIRDLRRVLARQYSPAIVGAAIRQLVANGETPNWNRFEGYLRAIANPPASPLRNGARPGASATDAKGAAMLIL